jgi:Uma2 family endonuclease
MKAIMDADEQGYRLEIIDGLGVWEVMPSKRHIKATARIDRSVRPDPEAENPGCGCVTFADLYVRFPDGSLRRPDVAVYCREPDEEDEAVTLIPEAVIEVLSAGSERKDLELSPPFYLRNGVKDVVVLDPYTDIVWHHRREAVKRLQSPTEIRLACGCLVTV